MLYFCRSHTLQSRGIILVEFALAILMAIPFLIVFYGYWEISRLKKALNDCVYMSAQASSNMGPALSGGERAVLTTICQHGNPDSSTSLLHPALASVNMTFNQSTVSGQRYVEIIAEAPFTPSIFSEVEVQKYLPISSLTVTYVQAFN